MYLCFFTGVGVGFAGRVAMDVIGGRVGVGLIGGGGGDFQASSENDATSNEADRIFTPSLSPPKRIPGKSRRPSFGNSVGKYYNQTHDRHNHCNQTELNIYW